MIWLQMAPVRCSLEHFNTMFNTIDSLCHCNTSIFYFEYVYRKHLDSDTKFIMRRMRGNILVTVKVLAKIGRLGPF